MIVEHTLEHTADFFFVHTGKRHIFLKMGKCPQDLQIDFLFLFGQQLKRIGIPLHVPQKKLLFVRQLNVRLFQTVSFHQNGVRFFLYLYDLSACGILIRMLLYCSALIQTTGHYDHDS